MDLKYYCNKGYDKKNVNDPPGAIGKKSDCPADNQL